MPQGTSGRLSSQNVQVLSRIQLLGSHVAITNSVQLTTGCAGLPDIERLNRKLERRKIGLADLCQLYRASSRLPLIEQALREHEGEHAELLCDRCALSAACKRSFRCHASARPAAPRAAFRDRYDTAQAPRAAGE